MVASFVQSVSSVHVVTPTVMWGQRQLKRWFAADPFFSVYDLIACRRHFATNQWGSRTCSSLPRVLSTPQSRGVSHSAVAELRGIEAARVR